MVNGLIIFLIGVLIGILITSFTAALGMAEKCNDCIRRNEDGSEKM